MDRHQLATRRDMEILMLLIPLSLLSSTLGLLAFVWAVNNGQFDDVDKSPIELLQGDQR